jgi:hypothetical protein
MLILLVRFASTLATTDMLSGTTEAQSFLHKWQHPSDCSTTKWITTVNHPGGVGSQLNVNTAVLACAINLGAIFVWGPSWYMSKANRTFQCEDGTFDCVFLPITNCTRTSLSLRNKLKATCDVSSRFSIPNVFRNFSTDPYPLLYWWRAQASMYFIKFNKNFETDLLLLEREVNFRSEIPCGTVCVHVRHGDKGREMRLLNWDSFVTPVRSVQEMLANGYPSRRCVHRTDKAPGVFLTSDDDKMFSEASKTFNQSLIFINDTSVLGKSVKNGHTPHLWHFFRVAMLNIAKCLECDGFVLQRGSNFARIIDQLRLTTARKLTVPIVLVGDYTFSWK